MSPVTDLAVLLAELRPALDPREFVFLSLSPTATGEQIEALAPLATFQEREGLSLVVERERAERLALPHDGPFRCITLEVPSSLHAVGLTAAVARALARGGIAANVIAAARHDHVFVPQQRAREALDILRQLSRRAVRR